MKDIKKNNALIAMFMGAEQSLFGDYMVFTKENPQYVGKMNFNEIHYHDDWNWIMPVVAKIEGMGYNIEIDWCFVTVRITSSSPKFVEFCKAHTIANKLQVIYEVVLDFIKWHNNSTK